MKVPTFYTFLKEMYRLAEKGESVDLVVDDLARDVVHDEDFPKGRKEYEDYQVYLFDMSGGNPIVMKAFDWTYDIYLTMYGIQDTRAPERL